MKKIQTIVLASILCWWSAPARAQAVHIQSITDQEIKDSGGNGANNWAEPIREETPASDVPPLVSGKNLGKGNMMSHPVRGSRVQGDYTRFRITMCKGWEDKQFKPGFPGTSGQVTTSDANVARNSTLTNKDSSSLYISTKNTGDATLSYTVTKTDENHTQVKITVNVHVVDCAPPKKNTETDFVPWQHIQTAMFEVVPKGQTGEYVSLQPGLTYSVTSQSDSRVLCTFLIGPNTIVYIVPIEPVDIPYQTVTYDTPKRPTDTPHPTDGRPPHKTDNPPPSQTTDNSPPPVTPPPPTVVIFYKVTQETLEQDQTGDPVPGRVVQLFTTDSPDPPTDGEVRTAEQENKAAGSSPVECVTDAAGQCPLVIPEDESADYNVPSAADRPAASNGKPTNLFKLETSAPLTNGAVVETTDKNAGPDPRTVKPPNTRVVMSDFNVGDRTFTRLTFAIPYHRDSSPIQKLTPLYGKAVEEDICSRIKPAAAEDAVTIPLTVLNHDLAEQTISLQSR